LYFERLGLEVKPAAGAEQALSALDSWPPDLIIADICMPGMSGLEMLDRIHERIPGLPVIMMTAYDEMENAIQSIQRGAYEYVEKPLDTERLRDIVEAALQSRCLGIKVDSVAVLAQTPPSPRRTARLIGQTRPMKQIFKQIGQVSNTRVTVLLQGGSGTGKELIARVIHEAGVTLDHPFIAVNCAVLSEGLLESELFGHVRGAFTGAIRDKRGKFALAREGTIFLDEIADISPAFQMKLLRVLQEREYEQVGGERTFPMQARVIAASNRDLERLTAEGIFREDLYYRLSVFRIDVPPLRDRRDDIPALVLHFLQKINAEVHKNVRTIPYKTMELLQAYDWPGNVRELENTLMQAVIRAKSEVLEPQDITPHRLPHPADAPEVPDVMPSLRELEQQHILRVLEHTGWNRQKTCSILGISKPTLNRKIGEYGLKR